MYTVPPDPALEPALTLQDMQALRADMGDALQAHQSLAVLDLGTYRCLLVVGEGDNGHPMPVAHTIPLGLKLLTQRVFKRQMPDEAQLEQGIMLVEDAVMPLSRLIPPNTLLATRDPLLVDIAQHALGEHAVAPDAPRLALLHAEAVESLFQSLVQLAAHPAARTPVPPSPVWAAALLLLREILHHWHIGQIRILPPATTLPASLAAAHSPPLP